MVELLITYSCDLYPSSLSPKTVDIKCTPSWVVQYADIPCTYQNIFEEATKEWSASEAERERNESERKAEKAKSTLRLFTFNFLIESNMVFVCESASFQKYFVSECNFSISIGTKAYYI